MTFIKIGIHERGYKQEKNGKDFRVEKMPWGKGRMVNYIEKHYGKQEAINRHQPSLFFEGLYENSSNISAKKTSRLSDLNYLNTSSSLGHPHSQYNSFT